MIKISEYEEVARVMIGRGVEGTVPVVPGLNYRGA